MTNTENAPTVLPPRGPAGYQPGLNEGVEQLDVVVERDGVKLAATYVFPRLRVTAEIVQVLDELRGTLAAMLVPKVAADVPPVAAPAPPAPDPAAGVRPPHAGAALVGPPAFPTRSPAPAGLEAMRAGATAPTFGDQSEPPQGPTQQERFDQVNQIAADGKPVPF